MNEHNTHTTDTTDTPADLRPLDERLGALARAARSATPPGLADRMARAGAEASRSSVIARLSAAFPFRLQFAAGLGVAAIGVVGGVLMVQRPGGVDAPAGTGDRVAANDADLDALVAEGVVTLRAAYESAEPLTEADTDSLWSLGLTGRSPRADEEDSLWDLGPAASTALDWPDDEETL